MKPGQKKRKAQVNYRKQMNKNSIARSSTIEVLIFAAIVIVLYLISAYF
ncbi:hypothetical protein H0266_02385 [Halobacillus locisalis]|uniref:Uncharacterized protein n=1 Tax=Halobacillus locisalis TaxID=220753 RepID=A0A838CPF8_9BACI|nr:hypothetical protein [Halobacillus locisalis]MBA2173738.1 hypothetical protein [Halobacillus locisalis]